MNPKLISNHSRVKVTFESKVINQDPYKFLEEIDPELKKIANTHSYEFKVEDPVECTK